MSTNGCARMYSGSGGGSCFFYWRSLYISGGKSPIKESSPELTLYAALSMIVVMAKVEYGEELTLWDYPTDIIPIFPPLTSLNLLCLPLIYSLVYQFFPTKWDFLKAALITTALVCFILEPLMAWGELYELLNWKYYLNFPLYAAMAIVVRAAVRKICSITKSPTARKK